MLQIILLILRIIGFVILTLLGLLLLVLLTVLLVPVRYRIHAEHGEKILVKGWVSWLLHLIHVSVSYIEEKLHIQVRIAGIILFDNLKPREPKVKKEKKKKRRKKKRIGTAKKNKVHNVPSNQAKTPSEQKQLSEQMMKKDASVKRAVSEDLSTEQEKAESMQAKAQKAQDQMAEPQKIEPQKIESTTDTKIQKQTILSFLKKKLERFREFQEKLSSGIQSFKKKLRDTFATIKTFRDKWELMKGFIKDKVNREGFQVIWKSLIKLLKHILPTRVKSKLVFGTGDPCSTGQLLGAFSILYSIYGDRIQITPDFENSRFEGVHDIKGRIRLISILIIVLRLILDKRFKQLRKNFTIIKEAL